MIGQLAYVRERLETSIWLIPIGFCLLALPLGLLMLWLDRQSGALLTGLQAFAMPVSSARQVLGVIAGSVISVAGVAFSITMVALTLTSGQYGPKLLRHFLEDGASKLSLGLFLGTYLYTLVVLTGFLETDRPQLTVITALLLALLALIGFIRFMHRTATDLQADEIVRSIGAQLRSAMDALVDPQALARRSHDSLTWRRGARHHRPYLVAARQRGYIQTIDYAGLVDWCVANDCLLEVRAKAGNFIIEGICLFKVYGSTPEALEEAVSELNNFLVTGPIRTPLQDPEYPITQLTQLAARALSPGINDPGTAITCIDWFSLALAHLIDRDLPGCVFLDPDDKPRLLAKITHFAGVTKAIYARLRQFSSTEVSATISLIESLIRLAELTLRQDRLRILEEHGRLIRDGVQANGFCDADLRDIEQRYRKLVTLTRRCC